eukprot:1143175-Pelagomonas_calceolata.AAC.1
MVQCAALNKVPTSLAPENVPKGMETFPGASHGCSQLACYKVCTASLHAGVVEVLKHLGIIKPGVTQMAGSSAGSLVAGRKNMNHPKA